jgi:hypothetical protein
MKNNRREFIKQTGMAGLAITTEPFQSALNNMMNTYNMKKNIFFISPVDGDMLSQYDGKVINGSLMAKVKISAPSGQQIKINGKEAKYDGNHYNADIELTGYENIIEATDIKTGEIQSIKVFWLKNVIDKYRLSLDDNIWFLKDITSNSGRYKSIFENPYMGFLKEVHDQFGTKIHLNLYYQTDGFSLSQMTAKYRNEWRENSEWLRLSFHALQNDPDRPYINAGYDEVSKDCGLVTEQIRRFAGEELMGPVTTLHWGEGTVEGCRALRDHGYSALAGYFSAEGPDTVSYYLNEEQRLHVNKRFLWSDNKEGIIFSRMAMVINLFKSEQIVPYLDSLRSDSHKPPYLDLMIHEQYFYTHYKDYQPDYRGKVLTSARWAADKGYQPAFLSECIFN